MTGIFALLGGKWLVGGLAALGALLAAFITGRVKGKAAGTQAAAGQVQEAQNQAVAARSEAQAAKATTEAIQTRQEAAIQTAAIPDDQLVDAARDLGILREDPK